MQYPFETPFSEVQENIEYHVDAVFSALGSNFLTLPMGVGFIEYSAFQKGYETLMHITSGFTQIRSGPIAEFTFQQPIILIVLRTILGITPSEWAEITNELTKTKINQTNVRTIDRNVRLEPEKTIEQSGIQAERIKALVDAACKIINMGPNDVEDGMIHRLNKIDTVRGSASIASTANKGVPYSMLLYERLLGRPFAGHRDSVSEYVGEIIENAIEELLIRHKIRYKKTSRAERIEGFEQAPDFIVPDEYSPQIVIEAKLAEDDGTARDKVTRIQHLYTMSMRGKAVDEDPQYELIACISGRGFKQRRQDMKKLLHATKGKIFTMQTLHCLIESTKLQEFIER